MGASLTVEQVLAEEAREIHGENSPAAPAKPPSKQGGQPARFRMNADRREGTELLDGEVGPRKAFYRSLNKLKSTALCCSGGGIRSASFCLGVIQALAAYDVKRPAPPARASAPTSVPEPSGTAPKKESTHEKSAGENMAEIEPQNSLLGRFHYLSTVSGGGYVGSWLSSWRMRNDFPIVLRNLTGRPSGADVEPPEISWLRAYSNYLTPRLGIASADSWAAVAIVVRNLILNWLIIIPVVCLVLLVLKLIATVSVWIAHDGESRFFGDGYKHWPVILVLVIGVICLIVAQAFTTGHRPPRRPPPPVATPSKQPGNVTEKCFLLGVFVWAVVSAIAVTIFFSSAFGVGWVTATGRNNVTILTALASVAIYALGWVLGFRPRHGGIDFICWALSGLVYGALIGLGAGLYTLLGPYPPIADRLWGLLLPIIFGVPWVLMSQLTADNIFGGLVSYEPNSDADREWLGRAAGWLAAFAIAWALVAFLVFAGGYYVQSYHAQAAPWIKHLIVASGGVTGIISGIATALLGSSSKTPAKSSNDDQGDVRALLFNVGLAVAGPIFVAVLIIGLSVGLDKSLLDGSLVEKLQPIKDTASLWPILKPLLIGLTITLAIGLLASYCVNINRFSLHALYRNRLIRAYLGASRQERYPDQFTGFDVKDNVRVHELWCPKQPAKNAHRMFHVINIALNVVSTKRLAWQERKAEPFTVSPLHCGSACLGFRSSNEYGDSERTATGNFGIALGTAMAISGAAVSPNMGYHSSPSIALLLTLFNVRLGWWLGNPGQPGDKRETYRKEGPKLAALPLLFEAFGQTTDERSYVYLSDGGHFENLGLYEMVRRRCRFIVVIDAGCDPEFAFEDLGNAVRKIYIDLGIRIEFNDLQTIRNRPSNKDMRRAAISPDDEPRKRIPYYAIGTIGYVHADGEEEGCEDGFVLYIKPAYHGTEGAGIRSYAEAHPTFPHESTVDQWFTESEFESYRSLGLDVANDILGQEIVLREDPRLTLHQALATLNNSTPR